MLITESKTYNFLFVEDVKDDVKLAERFLRSEGLNFNYDIVDCEQDLIDRLNTFHPDLIITDFFMPGYDGLKVIATVKKLAPDIPVIVFTGSINEETAVKCIKAGAVDYVIKESLLRLPFAVKDALSFKEQNESLKRNEIEINRLTKELEEQNLINRIFLIAQDYDLYFELIKYLSNLFNCAGGVIGYLNSENELIITGNVFNNQRLNKAEFITLPQNKWFGVILDAINNKRSVYDNSPIYVTNANIELMNVSCSPIIFKDKVLGIIILGNKNTNFDENDILKLNKISDYISPVMHAKLEKQKIYNYLKLSEEKFFKAFHSNSVGMLIFNTDGDIIEVNKEFCRICEYSETDLLNANIKHTNIFNKEFFDDLSKYCTLKNSNIDFESELNTKSGLTKYVSIKYDSIFINNINNCLIVVLDITKRKETEHSLIKSENLFRTIWENSKDGMRLTDKNGIMVKVNEAFCICVEKTKEELEGALLSEVYAEEHRLRVTNSYINNFNKKKINKYFEKCYKLWNGKEVWFAVSNSFIYLSNEGTLVLSIFRDISEQKTKEQELIIARNEAIRSNQLKDAFIANISHEIRTPLNGILGMTSILKESIDNITEEQEDYFNSIYKSSNRIVRTIDMIVNFSRLAIDDFPFNPVYLNLKDICSCVIREYLPNAKMKGLEIKLDTLINDTEIFGDEYSITNAILYLVDNAIKFTEKGYVKLSILDDENDKLILIIEDTGIGISNEYLEHIFEPYSQEDFGYRRKYEGVGLGLTLSKKFFELNNAKLSINSQKGIGTTVIIYFNKLKQG